MLKFLLLIIAIILIPPAYADVLELHIFPENPVQGDTITISGKASPDELINIIVSYDKTLTTSEGRYLYRIDGINIPPKPNCFTVIAEAVENINIRIKLLIWWTVSADASAGTATISHHNMLPGIYEAQIDGVPTAGTSTVMLKMKGERTIEADHNGNFECNYTTDVFPTGEFILHAGTLSKTIFLSAPQSEGTANDEYIMNITIDSNENVTFANHTSAADGNWIDLTKGTAIKVPSLNFIYSGVNNTSYKVNERDISVHLNVENNKQYTVEYPFSTHPMYTNVSSKNKVNMSYNGSSYFENKSVDIYLIKTAPTALKDAFDNITRGDTTIFRNLLNESVNKSLNCSLDSEGDTANISFGPLDAGDYVVVLLLNSSYLPNVNDLSILSATAFMVLEYESEVSVASAVNVEDILPVSITVNASEGEYTYGAILIHSDAYYADVRLTCNGSRDGTNLTVDGAYLIQGYQIVGNGLSNVNCSTIQDITETIMGPNNGTVSYKNTNTNSTIISLTTNDLRVGEYILITAVYKSGELLVALNQSEISIFDDCTLP